jgi:hypothetical protein
MRPTSNRIILSGAIGGANFDYLERNLVPGETALYKARLHGVALVWRVLIKTGFIARKRIEVLLPKVESTGVDESAFGRVLG